MIEIQRPAIRCVEETQSYGKFIAEPLERGYGTTLGNSLRRVLLSSLPGTAVTNIKIDGIHHEFTTVPGVKEDVTELVLNIKSLIVRLDCDGPKTLYLTADGPKDVKAGDITDDGEVEILNPDLHIATLSDGARLTMELTLNHGRGYVAAEHNKPVNAVIGLIPIDSIYNPVLRVNYNVEPARVGSSIDNDKLTFEVYTDKTISPRQAVSIGADILREQLDLFADLCEMPERRISSIDKSEPLKQGLLDMSIEELELSVRSFNCLKRANINTVADLVTKTEDDMMKTRNLGKKSMIEVQNKLSMLGLSLALNNE
ncbi:MAG: DNA-directed RNA polymerase subunit alpha [Oscillospiraceae bacterium]|jgi:DNA-directed RNA polymerase subunit alpha|nr:DNA-directed RNA polymerase subunit alpha [Oscillospiraceae bacterium]